MAIDNASSNKIKENKYKILRMSLILGNGVDREEAINNFEDAAREIDAMNDETYLRDLNGKFYDTVTLEEEEKKLGVLVDYIGGRAEQRISLINDFANVTGYELTNLPPIKYHEKLSEYKDRLKYIREYLDNNSKLDILNKEVAELENSLNKTYNSKERAEERNKNDEKNLFEKFKIAVKKTLDGVTEDNIDRYLSSASREVENSKKSLEIFNKSFSTLETAGISSEEEEEYSSYVESAKTNYYENKEKEYLLEIYKLLAHTEHEYDKLLYKRDTINNILYDRLNSRKELDIKNEDVLSDIYELLEKQYKNIEEQKNDIDTIDYLSKEINDRRENIKELELDNQKVEILSLLKEFCIIDTYDETPEPTTETQNQDNITTTQNINIKEDSPKDTTPKSTISQNSIFNTNQENISKEEKKDIPSIKKDTNNSIFEPISNSPSIFDEPSTTNKIEKNKSKELEIKKNDIKEYPTKNSNTIFDNPINDDIFGTSKENNIEKTITPKEEKTKEEVKIPAKENQVVNVKDYTNNNIDEIISKANDVMKRVGKMLGVETEKEKIVSVENKTPEPAPITEKHSSLSKEERTPHGLFFNDNQNSQISNKIEESPKTPIEPSIPKSNLNNNYNNVSVFEVDNMGAIDIDEPTPKTNNSSLNNNLFFNNNNNNSNISSESSPLNTDVNDVFWDIPSEDGGLNELPDLPTTNNVNTNNFFVNNEMPEFKADFGKINGEA